MDDETRRADMDALTRLHHDEAGQGMTEYILIVVFIAIAVLLVLAIFKDKIVNMFHETNQNLDQHVNLQPQQP